MCPPAGNNNPNLQDERARQERARQIIEARERQRQAEMEYQRVSALVEIEKRRQRRQ